MATQDGTTSDPYRGLNGHAPATESESKMRKLNAALIGGLAATALVVSATAASASTTKPASRSGLESPDAGFGVPAGYTVVKSAPVTALNGTQSHGSVACPGTRQPSGGGALVSSSALSVNLNSSYPSGRSWRVDVNNTSGADTTFTVYAICLNHASAYTVATNSAVAATGTQSAVQVSCPANTVIIGGGALSHSFSTGVTINSIHPLGGSTWWANMNNTDATDSNFTAYAICRPTLKGYSVQSGTVMNTTPGTEANATASCPALTVPIGGGGVSTSYDTAVGMNSSYPTSTGWSLYENNGTASEWADILAYAICAGS